MSITRPVEDQLTAYNNRDIDQFVLNFSEDCVIEDGQGNLIMQGRAMIYEKYKAMFEASPQLHCKIVSRIVLGEYVLDEENVTGRMGNPAMSHVVAVYRIENDSITHVRFLR